MTHFLRTGESTGARRSRPHAVVTVYADLRAKTLAVEGGISLVKDGVPFTELPAAYCVTANGEVVPRQRGLVRVVSLSTFDPFHMLADVNEATWRSWPDAGRGFACTERHR